MSELLVAAGGVIGGAAASQPKAVERANPAPEFAAVTTSPRQRFDVAEGVYLTPRNEFVLVSYQTITPFAQARGISEAMDILPPAQALTYERAVALGRQATNLVREDLPEIDLGSAL
jgi:hypothetical protein